MKDEQRRIKEYYDHIQMTEDFKARLLALPEAAPQKPVPPFRLWKPVAVAALAAVISLSGLRYLAHRHDSTVQEPAWPGVSDAATERTSPVPLRPTEPGQEPSETAPVPTDPSGTDTPETAQAPQPSTSDETRPHGSGTAGQMPGPGGPEPRPTEPVITNPPQPVQTDPPPVETGSLPPEEIDPPGPEETDPPEPISTDPPPDTSPIETENGGDEPTLVESDFEGTYHREGDRDLITLVQRSTGNTVTLDLTGMVTEHGYSGTHSVLGHTLHIYLVPYGQTYRVYIEDE